jgi:hypothetical protein
MGGVCKCLLGRVECLWVFAGGEARRLGCGDFSAHSGGEQSVVRLLHHHVDRDS